MDGLSAPEELKAEPGNHKVHLSWNMVEGATSYNLYWSTSEDVSKQSEDRIKGLTKLISFEPGEPADGIERNLRGKYKTRADKRYCSDNCRVKYNQRKKAGHPGYI